MGKVSERSGKNTVVREPVWGTAGFYVAAMLGGAGLGWALGLLADWLVTLPWAPMQGPAKLVDSVPAAVLPAVGILAGAALGLVAQYEQLTIRLQGDEVVLTRKGQRQSLSRADIGTFCRDGGQLVVLGGGGGELARHECGIGFERVAGAVVQHGHQWADTDPYTDEFRLWVPGLPGFPEGVNALLKARQKALEDDGSDDGNVRELREELGRLGIVVKDEKRRQYVRTT